MKKDLDCQNLGHYLLEKLQDKTNMAIQDKWQKYLSHRALLHALLLATNNQCQFRLIIQQEKQIVTIAMNTGKYLLGRPNLK